MIADLRIVIDRDGLVRLAIDGQRVAIPETRCAATALEQLALELRGRAWKHGCTTGEALHLVGSRP